MLSHLRSTLTKTMSPSLGYPWQQQGLLGSLVNKAAGSLLLCVCRRVWFAGEGISLGTKLCWTGRRGDTDQVLPILFCVVTPRKFSSIKLQHFSNCIPGLS